MDGLKVLGLAQDNAMLDLASGDMRLSSHSARGEGGGSQVGRTEQVASQSSCSQG